MAGTLALRARPVHGHHGHIQEASASKLVVPAGFLSGIFVRSRDGIRLAFASLGGFGKSLSLRCCVAARSWHAAEISRQIHMQTAKQLNLWDNIPERKVWFQFGDSHITFEPSYLARLNYVHYNPARHGVVALAENYKWCSASWFAGNASPAFVNTVKSFKTDRVQVPDDF